jgi:hypothetical protein
VEQGAVAVSGAQVTVIQGLRDVVAQGPTDAAGRRVLLLPPPADTARGFELDVRKLGFERATRYVRPRLDDTVSLIIVLSRTAQTLDTMRVTEQEDVKRRNYHVGADEIASSSRFLGDAGDIIEKVRPQIVWGLRGRPPIQRTISATGRRVVRRTNIPDPTTRPVMTSTFGSPCESTIQDIWINGKRVVFANDDPRSLAPRDPSSPLGQLPGKLLTTLALIHAEHVAEMTFVECGDYSVVKARGDNALFVTLKPGVRFEQRRGTYVVPTADDDSTEVQQLATAHLRRIAQVVDALTGEPIPGVSISRIGRDERAVTSAAGTALLSFLPEGEWILWIERSGYAPTQLDVRIEPGVTSAITIQLARKAP